MKVAVAIDSGRVLTVLDFARHVLLVECRNGIPVNKSIVAVGATFAPLRAAELARLGVKVILCGAVSTPLKLMLTYRGIEVQSGVAGPADKVVDTFAARPLERFTAGPVPAKPGKRGRRACCGRKRGRGKRHGRNDMYLA